jgi:hypothetical protein
MKYVARNTRLKYVNRMHIAVVCLTKVASREQTEQQHGTFLLTLVLFLGLPAEAAYLEIFLILSPPGRNWQRQGSAADVT